MSKQLHPRNTVVLCTQSGPKIIQWQFGYTDVEVWAWISNCVPYGISYVITYPCPNRNFVWLWINIHWQFMNIILETEMKRLINCKWSEIPWTSCNIALTASNKAALCEVYTTPQTAILWPHWCSGYIVRIRWHINEVIEHIVHRRGNSASIKFILSCSLWQ